MNDARVGLDSSNRLAASVLGLVLALAGGYGLVRGLGGAGAAARAGPLLDGEVQANIVENAGWVGGVGAFVALLVAWLGWRWLRLQLAPSSPVRRIAVRGDGQGGRTSVDAGAVAEAVTRDLLSSDHVAAGRVRIVGLEGAPRLALTAEVAEAAELKAVRDHVADHLLPRARTALGRDDLPAHLRLGLADPGSRTLE